jgi:hypothetical protein
LGGGLPRLIVFARHAHLEGLSPNKTGLLRRLIKPALGNRGAHGPFSDFFNVAASRPAK